MDIITTPPYEEMQKIYNKYFSLNFLGNSISNKFALISLTCYLTYKLKAKNQMLLIGQSYTKLIAVVQLMFQKTY